MPKKPPGPLQTAVSARLTVVQEELGKSDAAMGTMLGCGRTTWGNWVHQENMPEENAVIRLCDKTGLTMEWLYRGITTTMPVHLLVRLELRLAGINPDTATPEQREKVLARAVGLNPAQIIPLPPPGPKRPPPVGGDVAENSDDDCPKVVGIPRRTRKAG